MTGRSRDGTERRSAPRRQASEPPRPRAVDESWFGALSSDGEAQVRGEPAPGADESRYDGWGRGGETTDSRFLTRQARRIVESGQTAFQRIYRAFIGARAALGIALVAAVAVAGFFGVKPPMVIVALSVGYAALTVSTWLLPRLSSAAVPREMSKLTGLQWLGTIGIDIACFSALHLLSPVATLNYAALLVLPVLMAGVLTPRTMALATAAMVTLVLLCIAGWGVIAGGEVTLLVTQAGLAGTGFFVVTLLAGELAGRLAREELTAKGSLELARQQAQLNRLVIEEMEEGVLVVDRRGRVRAANPAARLLLSPEGMAREAPFQLRTVLAWRNLVSAVERAFAESAWPEAGRDVVLDFDDAARTLRVRMRFTRRRESNSSEELCVLFLEDVRSMQARTRQEKLAAMGRVSAGIAHEIRNPLAAIAQANALMAEDATTASQRQLTRMVTDNVERLKRIVDDVMEVAPGVVHVPAPLDATGLIASVCSEWARTNDVSLRDTSALQVVLPEEPVGVVFDADHLRRVLVNLLDNGYRHATKTPGSVTLRLYVRDDTHAVLSVASDGEPIPADVERHLFEPFFSTRSRGTGLGLYICRELSERYGARTEYRLRAASETNRNEFTVAMRRQALPDHLAADARLHLSS